MSKIYSYFNLSINAIFIFIYSLFQLIEYECRAKEQVLVLMRLGEDQTALRRALQSGDTDLIYTVLHHLRQKLSSGDFLVSVNVLSNLFF